MVIFNILFIQSSLILTIVGLISVQSFSKYKEEVPELKDNLEINSVMMKCQLWKHLLCDVG